MVSLLILTLNIYMTEALSAPNAITAEGHISQEWLDLDSVWEKHIIMVEYNDLHMKGWRMRSVYAGIV